MVQIYPNSLNCTYFASSKNFFSRETIIAKSRLQSYKKLGVLACVIKQNARQAFRPRGLRRSQAPAAPLPGPENRRFFL